MAIETRGSRKDTREATETYMTKKQFDEFSRTTQEQIGKLLKLVQMMNQNVMPNLDRQSPASDEVERRKKLTEGNKEDEEEHHVLEEVPSSAQSIQNQMEENMSKVEQENKEEDNVQVDEELGLASVQLSILEDDLKTVGDYESNSQQADQNAEMLKTQVSDTKSENSSRSYSEQLDDSELCYISSPLDRLCDERYEKLQTIDTDGSDALVKVGPVLPRKRMAYQVSDVLLVRTVKFKHQKPSLVPKCWKFMFKFRGLDLFGGSTYNGTMEQWLKFFLQPFLVIDTQNDSHFLVNNERKRLQQLKKSKLLKTWWFKYKRGTRLERSNIRFYRKIIKCRIQSSRDLPGEAKVATVSRNLLDRDNMIKLLKFYLLRAQNKMVVMANQHRTERNLEIGDYAYVKLQPYRQQTLVVRSNEKLSPKNYGRYKVVDKCRAVAYKLQQMVKVQEIDSTNGKSVNLHLANGASCSGLFYDVGRPLTAKGVGRKISDKMNETFHSNLEGKEIAYGSKKTLLAHGALPNNKIDGDSKQTNEKHDGLKENKKKNREAMEIGYGVDAYVWRKNMNGTCELQFKWILLLFFGSLPRPPEQGMLKWLIDREEASWKVLFELKKMVLSFQP